ncbi:MAG TPA: ATP-binding protein [Firmicutes bacterium]|nr:ATP-binding protein [Bacillota bacterium]
MQVVGRATHLEVYAASRRRKFRLNEVLVIADDSAGPLTGQVVETSSLNRYIPLVSEHTSLVDPEVLENLRRLGYRLEDQEVHLATIRLLTETQVPPKIGAPVRVPAFQEVAELLMPCKAQEGFILGVIRGTEEIAKFGLPQDLSGVAPLWEKGKGFIQQNGVPFLFPYRKMDQYPHVGIFGGSGSGKSYGLRVILEEIMDRRIPAVVFDPHYEMSFDKAAADIPEQFKRDYRDRYRCFEAGRDVGVNFEELSSEDLSGLLRASRELTEAMENAIKTLHKNKDSYLSFSSRLEDLIFALDNEREVRKKAADPYSEDYDRARRLVELLDQYGGKVGGSAPLKGIAWRLNRLFREGLFSCDITGVEQTLLSRRVAVIRGSTWFLQVLAAFVCRKLYQKRRAYRDALRDNDKSVPPFPPFFIVTDECHGFAPKMVEAPARWVFREIAQEGRKYGVFLVLATQRPALLDDTVTAQLNTKIIFRTVRATDIEVIKEETDITREEAANLPYLPSGCAYVSSAVVGRTVPVRIRSARTESPHSENPFSELEERSAMELEQAWRCISKLLPVDDANLTYYLKQVSQELGRSIGVEELRSLLLSLSEAGRIERVRHPFGYKYVLRDGGNR